MLIESVHIANFKTFKGEHSFAFEAKPPGLYYLMGKNKVEPLLGANGAGKSNFLDAVYWCFYGKTLRGQRGANIHTWKVKGGTVVRVTFTNGHFIERSWKPNYIKVHDGDTQTVEQDVVDDYLGVNASGFEFQVMVGQTSSMFLDLKPTAKLDLFSKILNLDLWVERSELAATQRDKTLNMVEQFHRSRSSSKNYITSIREDIKDLKKSSAEFKSKVREELEHHQAHLKKTIEVRDQVLEENEKIPSKVTKLINKANKIVRLIEKRQEKFNKANTKDHVLTHKMNALRSQNELLEGILKKFDRLGDVCPTCHQQVNKKHIKDQKNEYTSKIDENNKEIEKLKKIRGKKQEICYKIGRVINDLGGRHDALVEERNRLEKEQASNKSTIQMYAGNISQIRSMIKKVQEKKNPYKEMLSAKRVALAGHKANIKDVKKLIKKYNARADAYSYWVKGFKNIRLQILDESLAQFEVETNSTMQQLGLHDWTVKFDIERENSSGGVTKGFTVLINSPHIDKPVPWESWSGGESQRIRLATSMGLMNLMEDFLGTHFNIEVWDEPTKGLSPEGIECLLDVLEQRAEEQGKRIMLVEHHSLDYGGFKGLIKFTKGKGGTKITETVY